MLEGTTLYLLCVMNEPPYGLMNEVLYTSYAEALRGLQYWQPVVDEPLGIAEFRFVGCSCPGGAESGRMGQPPKPG